MSYSPRSTLNMLIILAAIGPVTLWLGDWAAVTARAQATRVQAAVPFTIGYLPKGSDFVNAPVKLEQLIVWLENQEAVARELARKGHRGYLLSPCDGPGDMGQRMNEGEFDLAFTTAVVFARVLAILNLPTRKWNSSQKR